MKKKKDSSVAWADTRTGQRRLALQVLYSLEFGAATSADSLRRTMRSFLPEDMTSSDFAWELVEGVFQQVAELEKVIGAYSKGWKMERIAKTELSILRLSLFEMLYVADMPLKAAINEGVELAKHFGDEHSSVYVNGILDAVAKDVAGGKFPTVCKA